LVIKWQLREPIFKALAPDDGYLHCGAIGSGHFVKMVHNGIEYGMMQAYEEGSQILDSYKYSESLDFVSNSHKHSKAPQQDRQLCQEEALWKNRIIPQV